MTEKLADPDFAADEETIRAAVHFVKDARPGDVLALVAIARKYRRALRFLVEAHIHDFPRCKGGSMCSVEAEVHRILEGE